MYEKSVWVRFYENPPVPQEAAVELAALRKNKKRRQKNFSKPNVGLSNILDRELCWGEPVEGPHR